MKFESEDNPLIKARFKIVRLDTGKDVPGEIIYADEEWGECILKNGDDEETHSFGYKGFRIVAKQKGN